MAVSASLAVSGALSPLNAEQYLVFVGTYTGPKSQGIYAYRLDAASGVVESLGLAAASTNPSFLAIHPDGRHLYAVNEENRWRGQPGGYVTAYSIDIASGKLHELNQQSTVGEGPCFLTVDRTGKALLAANYGGGSVVSFPIATDGSLSPHASFTQHHGSSVNRARQGEPHAHSINLSPDNRFAFVADLGTDEIRQYAFDADTAGLQPVPARTVKLAPGSGPRHFSFTPDARHAFAINELASTISNFEYSAGNGALRLVQTVSTLPAGYSGDTSTAEVRVHPSGNFVYGSNRGHDTIAGFRLSHEGVLQPIGHTSTQGKVPRNFNLDPTGKWLWAGNSGTDSIVIFSVNPASGALTPTGQELKVGAPVCIRFVPIK